MSETALLVEIRSELSRAPGVLIWRNNTGSLQDARGRWVAYGLGIGSADLVGIVECGAVVGKDSDMMGPIQSFGRFFALEVKDGKGKTTTEQVCWARAARRFGAFVATVRSVDDALQALERCRRGGYE